MNKCTFCDKEAVGFTGYQLNMYCEDHKDEAEKVEREFWEQVEKDLEGSEEYGD